MVDRVMLLAVATQNEMVKSILYKLQFSIYILLYKKELFTHFFTMV